MSPTRKGSGSGVTLSLCRSVALSLCHTVDNKRSNNSAAFHPFRPKIFLHSFKQKIMLSRGRGPKNSDLSSYLSYLTRYRSENCNLGL